MRDRTAIYHLFASLLEYPRAGYGELVERCRQVVGDAESDAAGRMAAFQSQTQALAGEDLEELYVRTFEHNPPCALEVGWHLFGENYDRGAFLVWMRAQLHHYQLAESAELPDHITHVLAVLGCMEDAEADCFARDCVLPALERLAAGLHGKDNPYEHAVAALRLVLTASHGAPAPLPVPLPVLQSDEFRGAIHAHGVCP